MLHLSTTPSFSLNLSENLICIYTLNFIRRVSNRGNIEIISGNQKENIAMNIKYILKRGMVCESALVTKCYLNLMSEQVLIDVDFSSFDMLIINDTKKI